MAKKNSVTEINKNVQFEEYARNNYLKEVILTDNVISIDGGGFRDCKNLTNLTIHENFSKMGAQAFASSPLSILTVIMKNSEKITIDFQERITGNDIMSTIASLAAGALKGNFSQTSIKNIVLIHLYLRGSKESEAVMKKNIYRIAARLIDDKNIDLFVKISEHKELFTSDVVDKLIKHATNKKGITEIRDALNSIATANGYSDLEDNNKKKSKKDIASEDNLVIENGRLKDVPKGKYKTLILPDTVKFINKKIFEVVQIDVLILPGSLKKITAQNFKNCKYIKEIVISDGVETIGEQAFMGCTNLKKVTLPSTLTITDDVNLSKTYFSSLFARCDKLCEITMTETHPSLTVQNNVIFDKKMNEIIFFPKQIDKLILPPSIKKYSFSQNLKTLSFTLQKNQDINMEPDYSVEIIECKVGDTVWSFDLKEQKSILFEADFEYCSDGLYPIRIMALCKFTNNVLDILQGRNYAFEDLGDVCYTDNRGGGPVHKASMFEFRLQLCKFAEETYGADYMTVSKRAVSDVVRNYGKGEDEPYLQNLVKNYFGNHLEHITALEDYSKLIDAALSRAVERRTVSECVNTITDLASKRRLSASMLNDILIFAIDKNNKLFHTIVFENCNQNAIDILKEDCNKLMKHLIDIQEIEAIIRLLDISCITSEKITEFITYAIDNKKNEVQVTLTNYKREHFN